MTKLMEKAIERLRELPEEDQDAYARLVMHQLDEADPWVLTSAKYPEALCRIVNEVDAVHQSGETEPLDLDKL